MKGIVVQHGDRGVGNRLAWMRSVEAYEQRHSDNIDDDGGGPKKKV